MVTSSFGFFFGSSSMIVQVSTDVSEVVSFVCSLLAEFVRHCRAIIVIVVYLFL